MSVAGKVVVMTGAMSGHGPGIAAALAQGGAQLYLADPGAGALAQALDARHLDIDPVTPSALLALCQTLADAGAAPDAVIINLALTAPKRAPESVGELDFDLTLSRLIRPVFLTARAFLPAMRARRSGALLTVATLPGPARRPRDVWTAAALGWLCEATVALAAETATDGIRVNALLPAAADTPALPKFMGGQATSAPPPPLGRYPDSADVGAAAVFLCSDAAGTVTGQAIPLDAGRRL